MSRSGARSGHEMVDRGVALGVKGGEAEVFELDLDLLDPQAMSQRRVDVEGFPRGTFLLPAWHGADRPEIVQSIAELDQQDTQVLRHRHQHLAERRRLLSLLGVETQSIELGDAVDDRRDLGTECSLDVENGARRVLDRVVQERSGDGVFVEAETGHDLGHGHRVHDVGLARLATLRGVGSRPPTGRPGR